MIISSLSLSLYIYIYIYITIIYTHVPGLKDHVERGRVLPDLVLLPSQKGSARNRDEEKRSLRRGSKYENN